VNKSYAARTKHIHHKLANPNLMLSFDLRMYEVIKSPRRPIL
jgi:hypothetical protein